MAKYFRWNPGRDTDSTYSGTVTKRFLKLDDPPGNRTVVSRYYKVDDVESGNQTLVHQNKVTGKPKKLGPITDDDFISKIMKFTNSSTKRNHCLSEWVVLRSGSSRMSMPYGGYLWRIRSGTTTQVASSSGTPYGADQQCGVGDVFFATEDNDSTSRRTPLHCLRSGDTGSMVPKSLAGTRFGFYSGRYGGSQIDVYALYDNTEVTWGETGYNGGGYNDVSTTSVDMDSGEIQERNFSTETSRIFISSTKDIIVSVNEANGGDRMMIPPASTHVFTRRSSTQGNWSVAGNTTSNTNLVVHSTISGNKVWATEIADGSGGDAAMGLGIEFLSNTFTYGASLSDYAIVAPFGQTNVTVKYHGKTNGNTEAWTTLHTHTIGSDSNTPISPAARFEDGNGNGGTEYSDYTGSGSASDFASGASMWWFEADKPVFIMINTPSNDEEMLLGWMRRSSLNDTWLSSASDVKTYIIDPDDDLFLVE